ncbi:hypothetical protein HRbin17_01275 [bacterium HR17]|jgi:hypothetical protein|uniref:Uncharacterized protein n=1 Tax=Candidatus Fervidibacter japonicus TaxID=2035412 RepID=A0A2H5XC40_9BACT|nr:hypothetical protein HRbin17_01275 [bacterium HR17]
MPQRPKTESPASQGRQPCVPLWAQLVAALWMVGVLVWFFTDPKIQRWLTDMVAGLLGGR